MFTVTASAADLIIRLRTDAGMPEAAGLRIGCREGLPSLQMRLADRPMAHDTVLRCGPVNVFLGALALCRLEGQTLDGRSNSHGSAFYLND